MMGADQRELQVRSRINRPEQGVTAEWQFPERTGLRTHLYFIAACVSKRCARRRAHRLLTHAAMKTQGFHVMRVNATTQSCVDGKLL